MTAIGGLGMQQCYDTLAQNDDIFMFQFFLFAWVQERGTN